MTIYQKLKRLAKPVVKAFHTDLTNHDRRSCRRMKPGETALWSCRECGTHFFWLAQNSDTISRETLESLRSALNWFDAVAKVYGNEDGSDQWYFLEKTGDAVMPITAIQARVHFVNRIRAIQNRLREAA